MEKILKRANTPKIGHFCVNVFLIYSRDGLLFVCGVVYLLSDVLEQLVWLTKIYVAVFWLLVCMWCSNLETQK